MSRDYIDDHDEAQSYAQRRMAEALERIAAALEPKTVTGTLHITEDDIAQALMGMAIVQTDDIKVNPGEYVKGQFLPTPTVREFAHMLYEHLDG